MGYEIISNMVGSAARAIWFRDCTKEEHSCIKRRVLIIYNNKFRYEDAKDFIANQKQRAPKLRCFEVMAREGCLTEKAAFYLRVHGCKITWID